MKLDILAFGAHPDDVELGASGTVLSHIARGYKVGIVDLTKGELGTRGSAETRLQEAEASSKILGITSRDNLGFRDGFFFKDETHLLRVIEMIRKYQPEIVLCNTPVDRHIDHGKGADLVHEACFLSGLRKIETILNGIEQTAWRPKNVYHYVQDYYLKPDVIVDITPFMEKKLQCIMAYSTQFYNPTAKEPATAISGKDFIDFIEARAREYGRLIGVEFGEGFTTKRPVGTDSLFHLR